MRPLGIAVAVLLAVSHTPWWLATIPEVYTWQLACFTGELLLLIRMLHRPSCRTAMFLFFLNGLDLSMHNLALLPLPVYIAATAWLLNRTLIPRSCAAALIASYLIGASPFLWLTIRQAIMHGSIADAVRSALFGDYLHAVGNMRLLGTYTGINAALVSLNCANIIIPCALVGWSGFPRMLGKRTATALGAITVIEFLFAIRYPVPDQFTFFLPTLAVCAVAASIGMAILIKKSNTWKRCVIGGCILSMLLPPCLYAVIPRAAHAMGFAIHRPRELPFRDELRYWIVPWKHNERSAELFARTALAEAAPDGIIVCDSTSRYPLQIIQTVENRSPDVAVLDAGTVKRLLDRGDQATMRIVRQGRLFVISPALDFLPAKMVPRVRLGRDPGKILYRMVTEEENGRTLKNAERTIF